MHHRHGVCTCYFDDVTFSQKKIIQYCVKTITNYKEVSERYMEPEIITKRIVGECSSSVTDSTDLNHFSKKKFMLIMVDTLRLSA